MRGMLVAVAVVVLSGCASHHKVGATTPRSVQIEGTAWSTEDKQKAFGIAQAECQKHGLHANYISVTGSKPKAVYTFDCVR